MKKFKWTGKGPGSVNYNPERRDALRFLLALKKDGTSGWLFPDGTVKVGMLLPPDNGTPGPLLSVLADAETAEEVKALVREHGKNIPPHFNI